MVSFSDIHGGEVAHGLLSVCRLSATIKVSLLLQTEEKRKGP